VYFVWFAAGADGREAFGVRRLAGAFGWPEAYESGSKLPHSKRFAPAGAQPIFIVRGTTPRGMASDQKIVLVLLLVLLLDFHRLWRHAAWHEV
jgi:hypothetical protein